MYKIYYSIIFFAALSSCATTSVNKQNSLKENMEKYKDDDLILAINVRQSNIANPQYNYELAIMGNGEIIREGGIYKRDYPTKASKEILDSIVNMSYKIKEYSNIPKPFVNDGPTSRLTIFGHPSPIDLRIFENEGVTKLLNYVDSVVILPIN